MPIVERPVLGGRYELGPALGSGGFGTVYRARDRRSGADVAIKWVLPGLGSEPAAHRLRREGTMLRRVGSRHVARVYDSGDDEHGVWLVTELVEGAPLTIATLGRALLPHEVLRVARGLLEGLAAVHAAGIVHGDVKPPNVLVPRTEKALDHAKIVDFGLARFVLRSEVAASIGEAMIREGTVLGTARYMAPEVLGGGEPTPRSDIYGAGLLLFELLDVGALFPFAELRAQLRARVSGEPMFGERVPEPLSDVLARMLARDPAARFSDAKEAHDAVVDLDTAPVSVVREGSLPPTQREQNAGIPISTRGDSVLPPSSREASPVSVRGSVLARPRFDDPVPPSSRESVRPRPPRDESARRPTEIEDRASAPTPIPPSRRPSVAPPRSKAAPAFPRLTGLPTDPVSALRETLRHLDLPMLDALARRERGNPIGRIARAVALALRLELDAAALILEPLALQSDVARAIGATVLAPRARRVTRARVDSDREDRWLETIDPELGAMLVALASALATHEDATQNTTRCARLLVRLEALPKSDAVRTTLRITQAAARVRRGELERSVAVELIASLRPSDPSTSAVSPFDAIVRSLSTAPLAASGAASSAEDDRTTADLEAAERIASETGMTLLDASAATAAGRFFAMLSVHDDRGLLALERAGTLLAHGDAPSLEHEAENLRALLLLARGKSREAIAHLRAAREAAHAERAPELEAHSAALETLAQLSVGDTPGAYQSAALLGEARLAAAPPTVAALGWSVRCLVALLASDHESAADALSEAESRVTELGDPASSRDAAGGSIMPLVFVMRRLVLATRGGEIELSSAAIVGLEDHAFASGGGFSWLALLGAVLSYVPDASAAEPMRAVLAHLNTVLGPKLARNRRTDLPPDSA